MNLNVDADKDMTFEEIKKVGTEMQHHPLEKSGITTDKSRQSPSPGNILKNSSKASQLSKKSLNASLNDSKSIKNSNKILPQLPQKNESLPDINSSNTIYKHEQFIELSHDAVDKLPNVMADVEPASTSSKGAASAAAQNDMHMIPPTSSESYGKPDRRASQGGDSKKTDVSKNPVTQAVPQTTKRVKKQADAKLLNRLDSQAAHDFTHEPKKELGRFSYAELQQTDSKTMVKSIQTSTIINELRKLNQGKQKAAEIDESSSEEEGTLGNATQKYQSFDPGAENQERNKQVFRKSYGMDINLPTYYIQDAKVYPKNLDFVLKAVKYILPKDEEYQIKEIRKNPDYQHGEEEVMVKNISKSYAGDKYSDKNCCLQLMKQEGKNLHVTHEVAMIDSKKVDISFSPDGQWFSLFRVKMNKLRIFKIDDYDVVGLMGKVERGEYWLEIDQNPKLVAPQDHGHNEMKQQFDCNSRFLVAFCNQRVTIVRFDRGSNNYDSNDYKPGFKIEETDHFNIHRDHPRKLDYIIDVTLVSTSDTEYRCDVAARMKGAHNVIIFDMNSKDDPQMSPRQINFEDHMNKKNTICKISNDFQKVILSVGSQNFILTKDEVGDGYTQKTISWIKDKLVTYIVAAKDDFIFICHKNYDQNLDIESSVSENFKIMVDRNIEPGILKVLDCVQENINEDGFGDKLVIINTKQERLFYDAINPQEKMKDLSSRNCSEEGTPRPGVEHVEQQKAGFDTNGTDALIKIEDIKENDRCVIGNYEYTPSGSHCVMWPYMTMSGIQETVWIYCAFYNPPQLVRLITPHEHGSYRIAQTYMTEDFDLYYLVENIWDQKFELWYTDLDNPDSFTDFEDQQFKMEKLFEYSMESVGGKQCIDMFVRSPSGKSKVSTNKKLFAFFLHKGQLYCWINGQTSVEHVGPTNSVCLSKVGPNEFVIRQDSDFNDYQAFTLKKVKAQYSVYSISNLYVESEQLHVKAYSYDTVSNMITVMFRAKSKNGVDNNRFKVYCLNTQRVLINFLVDDKDIIGRFVSELYTLIKGHYYFNNKVYKIRYDLFNEIQTKDMMQEEAFDKYEELLDLKAGETICANTPLVSLELHKMCYFTRNPKYYRPNRLIILPYLHERKIYLNKMKPTSKYFYTTLKQKYEENHFEFDDQAQDILANAQVRLGHDYIEDSHQADHEIVCIDVTAQKFFVYNEGGRLLLRHDYGKYMREKGYGQMVEASNNGRIFIFTDDSKRGVIHIFALQRTGFHLMRTIDLNYAIKDYAKKNVECQKTEEDHAEAYNLSKALHGEYATFFFGTNSQYEYAINDNMDFTVQISSKQEIDLENELNITFPMREQKTVIAYIKLEVAEQQLAKNDIKGKIDMMKRKNRVQGGMSNSSAEILNKMPIGYKIQILDRLQHSKTSIFYIERAQKLINKSQIISKSAIRKSLVGSFLGEEDEEERANQEVFITKSQEIFENFTAGHFTMNKDYVFFWNNYNVWFYRLNEISFATRQEFHQISLMVDPQDKDSWIKLVRAGSEQEQISIRVRQAEGLDCFLMWDLKQDKETYAGDCSDTAQQVFDSTGNAYIIGDEEDPEKDKANSIFHGVTFCEQGSTMKCYEIEGFNSKHTKRRNQFPSSYGFKFDERNHNWILCNEYIGLSFSFMTLVIRDRDQKKDKVIDADTDYMFDSDQYNFIINKRTFLTADPFFVQNHTQLEYVLSELKKVDPNLLEQLHYFYREPVYEDDLSPPEHLKLEIEEFKGIEKIAPITTPLHLAQSNNRSVNIILKYMSEIDFNASSNIKDILYLFVDNPSFGIYMAGLPDQTVQTIKKYTLQVSEQYNDHIVDVKGAPSLWVDNAYFEKYMHEDKTNPNYDNYPVKVAVLRMQWIFEKEGKLLLEGILNSSDLNIYDNKTMVVIIEFLYQYYRNKVLYLTFPIYLIQLAIFATAIMVPIDSQSPVKDFSAILNLISSLYTLTFIGVNTYLIPQTYFKSQWAYFEIVYFILNFIISIGLISTNKNWFHENDQLVSIGTMRQSMCFLSIVICSKSLYFMQIIDQIANIVTVIFLIFKDIFWFVIIFCIFMLSFSISFYQLAQNQLELDLNDTTTTADILEEVTYNTMMGSLSHTWQIALGQFNICAYSVGNATQQTVLYVLWVATIFFLMIHLLNFLIAIMGQTFSDNNDVKELDTLRSHLRFVLSNWWMNPIPNKERTQYLITAFLKEGEDDEGKNDIANLQNQIDDIKKMVNDEVVSRLYQITNTY